MHELLFMAIKVPLPANLAHKIKQIEFFFVVKEKESKNIEISDFITHLGGNSNFSEWHFRLLMLMCLHQDLANH